MIKKIVKNKVIKKKVKIIKNIQMKILFQLSQKIKIIKRIKKFHKNNLQIQVKAHFKLIKK